MCNVRKSGTYTNSVHEFCHVNMSLPNCEPGSKVGTASCSCVTGYRGLPMYLKVTQSRKTKQNTISIDQSKYRFGVNPMLLKQRQCEKIECPKFSTGPGGGELCTCVGNYSGAYCPSGSFSCHMTSLHDRV